MSPKLPWSRKLLSNILGKMKTIWLIRVNKIVLYFHYNTFLCKETDVLVSLLIKQTFIVDFPCVDIDNRVVDKQRSNKMFGNQLADCLGRIRSVDLMGNYVTRARPYQVQYHSLFLFIL